MLEMVDGSKMVVNTFLGFNACGYEFALFCDSPAGKQCYERCDYLIRKEKEEKLNKGICMLPLDPLKYKTNYRSCQLTGIQKKCSAYPF